MLADDPVRLASGGQWCSGRAGPHPREVAGHVPEEAFRQGLAKEYDVGLHQAATALPGGRASVRDCCVWRNTIGQGLIAVAEQRQENVGDRS